MPEISSPLKHRLDQYLGYINNQFGFGMSYEGAIDSLGTLISPDNFNGLLVQTGKALALIGIIPLYIFLLIYYKDFFWEFLNRLNTTKNQAFFFTWAEDAALMIQAYLTGLLKVTVIVALLVGCFFYVIDIQYFVLYSIFIAVLNLIPYVGVVFSSFFTVLYVFLTTDSIFFSNSHTGGLMGSAIA